jgi:hypothetical protein
MSVRANPMAIGAFVVGATILLVAGLLFWGGTGMFKTKYRYVMYFDAAVTGLQKGAPVLLRGVRVGEVTDVQIRWGTSIVGVYVAVEPDVQGLRKEAPMPRCADIRDRALRGQLDAELRHRCPYVAIDGFPARPSCCEASTRPARAADRPDHHRCVTAAECRFAGHPATR